MNENANLLQYELPRLEYDQEELRDQPEQQPPQEPGFLSTENIFTEYDKDNFQKKELEPVSSLGQLTEDALLTEREKAARKKS